MNKNQEYVKLIEGRILSLQVNKTPGWESTITHLNLALADVRTRLTPEELAEVKASQQYVMTAEEQKVQRAEEAREMANNRDKPSI